LLSDPAPPTVIEAELDPTGTAPDSKLGSSSCASDSCPARLTAFFKALSVSDDYMSFGVRTVYLDGDVELAVRGEIDLSVAEQFWKAIEEAMSPDRPLVLDMQEVTFFDSSGLLALLRALSKLNQDPTKLILRSPSPVVMRVLRVTDLDQRMTIQDRGDDMEPTKHALN